jgi:alpha-glucosidase
MPQATLMEPMNLENIKFLEAEIQTEDYQFVKVEDFFSNYENTWDHISHLEPPAEDAFDQVRKMLTLTAVSQNGLKSCLLIQIPRKDIYRFRFNPGKTENRQYTPCNTETVRKDTFEELIEALAQETNHRGQTGQFELEYHDQSHNGWLELLTKKNGQPFMKVKIQMNPYQISIFRLKTHDNTVSEYLVHSDAIPSLYYQKKAYGTEQNFEYEYSIIQCKSKADSAQYFGFGEKGGDNFYKNGKQMNFFNFDNMRYSKVYNKGPLEDREPLYHSNPFFLEFYGVPSQITNIYGIYIDNYSQVLLDMGSRDPKKYLMGTRFNDLDYYFFLGDSCSDIIEAYTAIIGRANLPPRYALGYHQGCYGYDTEKKLCDAAEAYRKAGIPIDGLHIDVDLQQNYRTFTIDEGKFPYPTEMFQYLRGLGYKCSTNITPIISDNAKDHQDDYPTYKSGIANNCFVLDKRSPRSDKNYHDYSGGTIVSQAINDSNYDKPYVGQVFYGNDYGTTGNYPDLGREEVQQWWGDQYNCLFKTGLEMVWQDMTTPCIGCNNAGWQKPFSQMRGDMGTFPLNLLIADNSSKTATTQRYSPFMKVFNLYSYNLHKATYEGLNRMEGRENKRNFIIGRGCYSGMHKYAALWTGDNASTWDFMRITLHQILALGLSGQPITGSDVGGFEPEEDWKKWADPELLIRWTIMGAFLPWFRNHYNGKPGKKCFQEPYAYDKPEVIAQVPWDQQAMYHCVLPVCKHYIELRYRLMQLFYDCMFENIHTGRPICRPLFVTDVCDPRLFTDKLWFLNNEFFVGDDLLVAPILSKQNDVFERRDVYLPVCSRWYNFKDNKQPLSAMIPEGSTISFEAGIYNDPNHYGFVVPLFVREGGIIPTLELEQYVGQRVTDQHKPNQLTLNIYPVKPDNLQRYEYNMYLDDGVSRSSAPNWLTDDPQAKSEYCYFQIRHQRQNAESRQVKIDKNHDNFRDKAKYFGDFFFVAILHDPNELQADRAPLRKVRIGNSEPQLIAGGNPEERSRQLGSSPANAWYYNEDINISFIKVFDTSTVGNPLLLDLEY